ncbi:MAG: thioredoxin family protein [Acidibacillus sp.]|uniref:Thioredoxin-like fold domain-containing protein n=1 Tax=Sulfoacidibacillus ferrooxidans TaxID=2005001 RepID=A0A9X2ADV3_9BACL|nr:thioredoxin family protein [Sulfoacidibacillus ferrooxidans]MCI0182697.1 hypothetical protein [Sulfoacidibacillus ferrooxidans]MCY0892486.1 thioredoxin family protein [Acidibacillus sp.]
MNRRYHIIAGVFLAIILIGGPQIIQWHEEHTNPPFQNLLTSELTTPLSTYNPQTIADPTVFTHLTVYTASGKPVVLNASHTPLLFEAYWCPHCQRTLVLLNANKSHLRHFPIMISTGFAPNTSLQTAKHFTAEEESAFSLHGITVYYLLAHWRPLIKEFPMLIFPSKSGKIDQLMGEHTFPIWKKALDNHGA